MEKNIKKRVCWLAVVLSAVLVVLFGYWFFLNLMAIGRSSKKLKRKSILKEGCFGESRRL